MDSTCTRKRISFLIPCIVGGGAEKVMSTLVNQLSSTNNEIDLINMEVLEDEFPINNKVNRFSLSRISAQKGPFWKMLAFPFQLFNLIRFVRKNKPATIVAFLERAVVLTLIGSFFFNSKLIISERNSIIHNLENRSLASRVLLSFVYRHLFRRADKIVAVSKAIRAELINNYELREEKIVVLYNPYDADAIEESKKEKLPSIYTDFFQSGKVLLNVGRYYAQKNQLHLIEVFSELLPAHPDLKLCIIGKGPLEAELTTTIHRLKLGDKVLLPGFQKNPYSFFANSTIYVMTSNFEGFPNALVESMIAGTPVVAYNCESGPAEILQDNVFGLLIPLHDRQKLKESISSLLNDRQLYLHYKNKGIERGRSLSVKTFIEKFERLL